MKSKLAASLALLVLPVGVAACGGSSDAEGSSDGSGGSVDLVAYSTPQTAYEETLDPRLQGHARGRGRRVLDLVRRRPGDQSRAVEAGQPADFVHLPIEPDITRLVDAGIVRPTTRRPRRTAASSRSRSSRSASVRATRRTSRTGTTWSATTSRSSPRTRSPRAAPAGTSWPPTARRSRTAPPRTRPSSSSGDCSRTRSSRTPALVTR